ncbi:hypothetical protein [Blastococcus brunescens]|uniref:Helix-turn-helix domain-containing protein n=1 Tax=Blastococcus brunescens TaxID=1564165 RepID=A0ABZ1B8L6_9ACTN|nr:hypothetical protein [Blastococcus sp. BMG 8361]WRL66031.1 hypothetical protein U6N30_11070 [Blastococcus sp. BMG 8361]
MPELLAHVSRSTLRNWVAAGKLVRLQPGVLALPGAAGTGGPGWPRHSTVATPSRVT